MFFDEKLAGYCMNWLCDSVFSIREAAITNLRKLVEIFGSDWAIKSIFPKVIAYGSNTNHLFRMTTVFALMVYYI